jgi:hypothetical protein
MVSNNPNKDERFETRYELIFIRHLPQADHASQAARCHYSATHGVKRLDRYRRFRTIYIVSIQLGSRDTDERNIYATSGSLAYALYRDL